MMPGERVFFRTTIPLLTVIGVAYLAVGFTALYNWAIGLTGNNKLMLWPQYIPGDLGIMLVSLASGLALSATPYYYRQGKIIEVYAVTLCGLGLAVAATAIQVLATIATLLDTIIIGEEISSQDLVLQLSRIDTILGYVSTILLITYITVYKQKDN